MGCRKCGSGQTVSQEMVVNSPSGAETVLMEYIGVPSQKQRLKSKYRPSERYVFSGDSRRFYVYVADVPWLTAMATQFRLAQQYTPTVSNAQGTQVDVPTLISEMRQAQADLPIDVLTVDPIVLALLKKKFATISELRNAGRAEWLTIKHIGATRADEIQKALDALH